MERRACAARAGGDEHDPDHRDHRSGADARPGCVVRRGKRRVSEQTSRAAAAARGSASVPSDVITGHLGVAAAANATRRDSTLLWLLGASMAPDVVDALFVVARSCNPHGLYSHTVPAAALIAAVTGAAAYLGTNQRATGLLAALLVL